MVYINYLIDSAYLGYELKGHTAIAYASTSTSEPIYHMGYEDLTCCWIGGNYVVVGYDVIYPATYAYHICSSNYIDLLNNEPVCPHIFTNHEHQYISYSSINSLKHNKTCYCTHVESERHSFIEVGLISHCDKCGYIASGDHPILNGKENME